MRSNAIIMFMKELERRKRTLDGEANCNEIQRYHYVMKKLERRKRTLDGEANCNEIQHYHYVYEEVREKKEDLGRRGKLQ